MKIRRKTEKNTCNFHPRMTHFQLTRQTFLSYDLLIVYNLATHYHDLKISVDCIDICDYCDEDRADFN